MLNIIIIIIIFILSESERLRAILIALAIVIPAAIMAGVAIGICCLIYKASMANKALF